MPSVYLSANENNDPVLAPVLALLQDYLAAAGLRAALRPTEIPAACVASVANRGRSDFLLCLRAGEGACRVLYHPASKSAKQAASCLHTCLSTCFPGPAAVQLLPAPQIPDFRMAHCPAVHIVLGDDPPGWRLQCAATAACALAHGLCAYFSLPCVSPFSETEGFVSAPGGLALRCLPSPGSKKLLTIPNNAKVTLFHREGDWQCCGYEGAFGFCVRRFLR